MVYYALFANTPPEISELNYDLYYEIHTRHFFDDHVGNLGYSRQIPSSPGHCLFFLDKDNWVEFVNQEYLIGATIGLAYFGEVVPKEVEIEIEFTEAIGSIERAKNYTDISLDKINDYKFTVSIPKFITRYDFYITFKNEPSLGYYYQKQVDDSVGIPKVVIAYGLDCEDGYQKLQDLVKSVTATYRNESNDIRQDYCFAAGTQILMADGTFKKIEEISIGDEVQGYSFKTNYVVTNRVNKLLESNVDLYLIINGYLKVTAEHPFAVGHDEWKEAGKLQVGDTVLGQMNIEITSIKIVKEFIQVFNLRVDGTHNFYVSGNKALSLVYNKGTGGIECYLVHNKGGAFCLLNNSLVLIDSNRAVAIQDLDVGDSVLALHLDSNKPVNTKVTRVIKDHPRDYYYSINDGLLITNDHPVLVVREHALEWVRVEHLNTGDKIKGLGGIIEIKSIELIDKPAVTVYLETEIGNFIVKANDNLYVVKAGYLNMKNISDSKKHAGWIGNFNQEGD